MARCQDISKDRIWKDPSSKGQCPNDAKILCRVPGSDIWQYMCDEHKRGESVPLRRDNWKS